jgi:thiosulfate/3-mercaptopyruvate sulfurtransferase
MRYTTVVSPDVVYQQLAAPEWVIVDCRFRLAEPDAGREMYLEAHIPGAVYGDLNRDLSGPPGGDAGRHPLPDLDQFRGRLGEWGIDGRAQVVCYDDSGGSVAARLWWMLRYLRHGAVAVLDGGWQAWRAREYPVGTGKERAEPRRFEGEPRPEMVVEMPDVVAMGSESVLVDAREAARYRGEEEPIDPVAGHIPGALNRPTSRNLNEKGELRSPEELAETWQALLGDQPAASAVMYCGSGVSACQNLLAMEHAGLPGARLFVPSWSGWSANPERPVERARSAQN